MEFLNWISDNPGMTVVILVIVLSFILTIVDMMKDD